LSDQILPPTNDSNCEQHISEHVLSFELNTTQVSDSERQEYSEIRWQY